MRLTQIEKMLEDHEKRIKQLEREIIMLQPETPKEPKEDEVDMTEPEKPISSMKVLEPSRKTQKKINEEKEVKKDE